MIFSLMILAVKGRSHRAYRPGLGRAEFQKEPGRGCKRIWNGGRVILSRRTRALKEFATGM